MIGAIVGDIIGSPYERDNTDDYNFPLFGVNSRMTDDSYMSLATEYAFQREEIGALNVDSFGLTYLVFAREFPDIGYGKAFKAWSQMDDPTPYDSMGNGSAMRVSPVAYHAKSFKQALDLAELTALSTHNHPEGIRGAQVVAGALYCLLQGYSKVELARLLKKEFEYDFSEWKYETLKATYEPNYTCPGSVPEAIFCFLDSSSFVDAIRKAVAIGGDSDTIASIAGGLAEVHYNGVPPIVLQSAAQILNESIVASTIARSFLVDTGDLHKYLEHNAFNCSL